MGLPISTQKTNRNEKKFAKNYGSYISCNYQ